MISLTTVATKLSSATGNRQFVLDLKNKMIEQKISEIYLISVLEEHRKIKAKSLHLTLTHPALQIA